jgi:hypothetical protein
MTSQDRNDEPRFDGARVLLKPFRFRAVPEDTAERNARLEPMIRAAWHSADRGGRTLYETAAQLRAAADAVDAGRDLRMPGVDISSAALREIADLVLEWNAGRAQRLLDVTPTSSELAFRFPQLLDMLVGYYGQDGTAVEEYPDDPRRSLQVVIDDWHPRCLWYVPCVAAQCQEALTLFQTEEALRRFFLREHLGDSAGLPWLEWLPLIIDVFGEHMRAHHPPRWTA